MADRVLRLATRGSPLARWQASDVARRLVDAGVCARVELVVTTTLGDDRQDLAISEIARTGVFTSEVDRVVAEGRADLAVHSAKDLPASVADQLVIAAVPVRADPRDVLVGRPLRGLGPGAAVATGSVRRRVQLGALVPGLEFVELRGNIATRLDRVPERGAAVFALAALERLGLSARIAEVLSVADMLPQVGQGAIAVRCVAEDVQLVERLAAIDDPAAHLSLRAERAFLARLGGGCDAPVGAYATVDESGEIHLEVMRAALDGSEIVRLAAAGSDPELLGAELADSVTTGLSDDRTGSL